MKTDDRVWFHVILTTYGAWLYGDSRGFRTRHHRQHVDGDYKHPPIEDFTTIERRSRESLSQSPAALTPHWQALVGNTLYGEFTRLGAWISAMAVATQHVHLLAKTPTKAPRRWAGIAKWKTTIVLKQRGWIGELWGVRSKALPIRNLEHYENARRYILAHAEQGAWIAEWKSEPERVDWEP